MNTKTDITIVLDRSGSMQVIAADTIGGFNKFLEEQKTAAGEAILTLNQFDGAFETPVSCTDIRHVAPLNSTTFVPRGFTALLDAIGRTITETGARLAKLKESDRPTKVIIVIITDGEENASREFTQAKVNEMITHQREKYSWEFVFLAANQDAIKVGDRYGILRAASMTYAHTGVGATAAFASLSKNLSATRCMAKADMSFDDLDREIQAKAGVIGASDAPAIAGSLSSGGGTGTGA